MAGARASGLGDIEMAFKYMAGVTRNMRTLLLEGRDQLEFFIQDLFEAIDADVETLQRVSKRAGRG